MHIHQCNHSNPGEPSLTIPSRIFNFGHPLVDGAVLQHQAEPRLNLQCRRDLFRKKRSRVLFKHHQRLPLASTAHAFLRIHFPPTVTKLPMHPAASLLILRSRHP
ncbi:hypothetical protein KC19_2G264500 [Ceratodon purpureus]|uniref:Uncharacterized protein n=1 Tax=Ceratodon purpureus TaxID=3225 RepID=A0A8T0IYD4_CERPU|nr:hypothetical protein KC19_2G264500 [Ceratodon purpureus]